MKKILGVKFGHYGQVCYFTAPIDLALVVGDQVLVDTGQGLGCAYVLEILEKLPDSAENVNLSGILRKVSEQDTAALAENNDLAEQAYAFSDACIKKRKLDMSLVQVEVLFDRSKLIFYFTAPTRIDFRDLVKDLVREYHTRIELRQIGVRHETQMLGAIGSCGMVCCCRRFLRKFVPVTIKMAKEQNLFLNPVKISGICGRLLCCLSYEQENYDLFHASCPKIGKRYQTTQGMLRVIRSNLFTNSLTALNENNEEQEITLEDWAKIDLKHPDPDHDKEIRAPLKPHIYLSIEANPENYEDEALYANLLDGNTAPKQNLEPHFEPTETKRKKK